MKIFYVFALFVKEKLLIQKQRKKHSKYVVSFLQRSHYFTWLAFLAGKGCRCHHFHHLSWKWAVIFVFIFIFFLRVSTLQFLFVRTKCIIRIPRFLAHRVLNLQTSLLWCSNKVRWLCSKPKSFSVCFHFFLLQRWLQLTTALSVKGWFD